MPFAPQVSQFSDPAIPFDVAVSLCGPAAAIAFARVNGRSPSLQEARALAAEVGWTPAAGMAGPRSEQALLTKLGISADLAEAPDWNRITSDVQGGRPVIVSTPRHYFTVSDVDPAGRYYVGASGTDLAGGKEWMTREEIEAAGRGVNGVLHLASVPQERQHFLEANVAPQAAPNPPQIFGADRAGAGPPVTGMGTPRRVEPTVIGPQPDPADALVKKLIGDLLTQRPPPPVYRLPEPDPLPVPTFPRPRRGRYVLGMT